MAMVRVWVNPNLTYNCDYTALQVHYKYVHHELQVDALSVIEITCLF